MPHHSTTAQEEMLPLKSEAPIIIYIDFKSPYAYLAVAPAREMLAKLGLFADWRPFVLDIPSFLGSAKLDEDGKKVAKQNRTKDQWSGIKYAYFDCRRYANLADQTIRGTVKIWDTHLPAIGMLWLKRFSDLADQCAPGSVLERYIDVIYEPFWKREFDAEDLSAILRVLEQINAPTDGFLEYARGDGAALNARLQESAFEAGIYGVPTFIFPNESAADPQHQKFFGREHLPRISWLLSGRRNSAPDVAYALSPEIPDAAVAKSAMEPMSAPEVTATPRRLTTYFDFKSPQCYLALPSILALRGEGISVEWRPFESTPLKEPTEETAHDDRGTQHRRIRGEYHANDIQRYAPHKLNDIYRQTDCQFADMGLLWLQHALRASQKVIDGYVQRVFAHLWKDDGALDSARDIEPLLFAAGDLQAEFFETNFDKNKFDKKHFGKTQLGTANFETTGSSESLHSERTGREAELSKLWLDYARGQGLEDLDGVRRAAQSESISMAPTFSLGSEPFQGRAHFPLITARLKAGI